jgi:diguanylate cyclase (GGDEF)-like protein/PAS domain S-box-containing protein
MRHRAPISTRVEGSVTPRRRLALETALVAVAYFAAAKLGLLLSFVHGNVTPVYPAAGIAVAVLVLGGRRLWLGVFAGALAAHLTTDVTATAAVAMSAGNTVAAVVSATVLGRVGFRPNLRDVRNVVLFVAGGVVLPAAIAATSGITTLYATGALSRPAVLSSWGTWWVGDAMGAVVAGSLAVAWWSAPERTTDRREAIGLVAGAFVASGVLFAAFHHGEVLLLPLLVLVAVRLESRWATGAVAGVALIAAGATANGWGPFSTGDEHDSLVQLSMFLAAATLTTLVLSAAVAERDRAHRRLAEANDDLEVRVAARTAELAAVVTHITDAVAIVERDGVVRLANPACRQLLGLGVGDRIADALLLRAASSDITALREAIDQAVAQPGVSEAVQFALTVDGTRRHVEAFADNLLDDPDVGGIVVTARDVTGHELRARTLWQEARRDALTGLPNRVQFFEELDAALARRQPCTVLFADLDGLKQVNDSLGHAGGDALLAAVAERIRAGLRSRDVAARLAGDEFTVLAFEAATPDAARAAGERLLQVLSAPFTIGGATVSITASVGAVVADDGTDSDALLHAADAAMYRAKRAGGDRVELEGADV